jgi:hypothetical protein
MRTIMIAGVLVLLAGAASAEPTQFVLQRARPDHR